MKIYRILENGYYGGEQEVSDDTIGIPLFTTRTEPPEIPEGKFGFWNGQGWNLIDHPPPMPPDPIVQEQAIPVTEPILDNPPT